MPRRLWGEPVEIDRAIAELVSLVWDLGVQTNNSCENQDGMVVLTFEEAAGAEQFANAVACQVRPGDAEAVSADDLYNRIAVELEPDDGWQRFRRHRLWNFGAAHGRDFGGFDPAEVRAGFRGACDVAVAVAVRFPRADLRRVVAALEASAPRI